jgi:hypothetical protein
MEARIRALSETVGNTPEKVGPREVPDINIIVKIEKGLRN